MPSYIYKDCILCFYTCAQLILKASKNLVHILKIALQINIVVMRKESCVSGFHGQSIVNWPFHFVAVNHFIRQNNVVGSIFPSKEK